MHKQESQETNYIFLRAKCCDFFSLQIKKYFTSWYQLLWGLEEPLQSCVCIITALLMHANPSSFLFQVFSKHCKSFQQFVCARISRVCVVSFCPLPSPYFMHRIAYAQAQTYMGSFDKTFQIVLFAFQLKKCCDVTYR